MIRMRYSQFGNRARLSPIGGGGGRMWNSSQSVAIRTRDRIVERVILRAIDTAAEIDPIEGIASCEVDVFADNAREVVAAYERELARAESTGKVRARAWFVEQLADSYVFSLEHSCEIPLGILVRLPDHGIEGSVIASNGRQIRIKGEADSRLFVASSRLFLARVPVTVELDFGGNRG